MKVEIKENTVTPDYKGMVYPYIGIHNDDIGRQDPLLVLFIAPDTGLIIADNDSSNRRTFNRVEDWVEYNFHQYDGSVTLTNSVVENRVVSDNKRKAIKIALDTYLTRYDGDPVYIYFRLLDEKYENFDDIDYIDVWEKFENCDIDSLIEYIDDLIEQILHNYGEEDE